jgi:ferritin-like metal-binding protein YciE
MAKTITSTREKFIHELADIYDAEHYFLDGMRQVEQQASKEQLRSWIQEHIQQTEGQIRNLEQVFQALGEQPKRVSCESAKGLVSDAQKAIQGAASSEIRDTLIDGGLSKVEHYEIASYRGLVTGAEQMSQLEVLRLLQENLQEEQTAHKLEHLAAQLLQTAAKSEGGQAQ